MNSASTLAFAAMAVLLQTVSPILSAADTKTGEARPLDLTPFLDLGQFYVRPVPVTKDPRTGFRVGGKNDMALIRTLTEINGRTIADLEKDMRPGAKSPVGSRFGFIGPKERLLDVLAADNQYIVEESRLTHQELAKHLHALGTIGFWQGLHKQKETPFVYHGRRFKVKVETSRGIQPSPFRDGTESGSNATVHNLDNGKEVRYGLLVPYMIERYGFYEGKGTPYRLEPRRVLEVFDFLKAPATKP